MNNVKEFAGFSVAAALSYFAPLSDVFFAILILFAGNFAWGLISGILVNRERFIFKKAMTCILEIAAFYSILMAVFFVGDHMDQKQEATQAVSTITYALIYFYLVNILKNVTNVFPGSKTFKFLYYLASVEFLKKIPYLEKYQKHERKADKTCTKSAEG